MPARLVWVPALLLANAALVFSPTACFESQDLPLVSARILDAAHQPLPDIAIRVTTGTGKFTARSDANGLFTTRGIGKAIVEAFEGDTCILRQSLNIPSRERRVDWGELIVRPAGALELVLLGLDGKPLSGESISLAQDCSGTYFDAGRFTTDDAGRALVAPLLTGTYLVHWHFKTPDLAGGSLARRIEIREVEEEFVLDLSKRPVDCTLQIARTEQAGTLQVILSNAEEQLTSPWLLMGQSLRVQGILFPGAYDIILRDDRFLGHSTYTLTLPPHGMTTELRLSGGSLSGSIDTKGQWELIVLKKGFFREKPLVFLSGCGEEDFAIHHLTAGEYYLFLAPHGPLRDLNLESLHNDPALACIPVTLKDGEDLTGVIITLPE